ncbi:malonic semialdehyde reductase [Actinoplanes sp. CA-051413]|uniref:malonic semialdehyde reductase n=1 Tax=Actinoplanes sp. CA-051413 TaxID=3239899 RepID=UPI003D98EA28
MTRPAPYAIIGSENLGDGPLERLDDKARHTLFTGARTANTFADTPVSDAELSDIWELARWAPTSANTQPLRALFVRPGSGRDNLVKHMNEGNRAKTAAAPAVAVLALDTRFHEHIPTVLPFKPELREVFAGNDAMRAQTASFNAALQAGYFILAVRAHGLAAGPMSGFDAAGVDAEFFPDGRFRSILVVNIGHPGENPWFGRLPRLEHDDVVQWA